MISKGESVRSLLDLLWYFGPKGCDENCCENLSLPEFLALDWIASSDDCAVHSIGNHLNFTKSGATRIVNRLSKIGYVKKMKSDKDGRICCVVITESGVKILSQAETTYLNQLNKLLEKVPDDSSQNILKSLSDLSRVISKSRCAYSV